MLPNEKHTRHSDSRSTANMLAAGRWFVIAVVVVLPVHVVLVVGVAVVIMVDVISLQLFAYVIGCWRTCALACFRV